MAAHPDTIAPLLAIPLELIEQIALVVPPDDLLALRRTCRLIRDGVQLTFVQTNFTDKTFLLPSPESMQALVNISKHAQYGKAMKQISFVDLQPRPRRTGKKTISRDNKLRRYYERHRWSPALTEALRNFKDCPGSMSIAFGNGFKTRQSPCGMRKLDSNGDKGPKKLKVDEDMGAEFFRAIVRGSCPITSFAAPGMREGISDFVDLVDPELRLATPTLFANLRALDVFLDEDTWFDGDNQDAGPLLDFFNGAPALEHLTLRNSPRSSSHKIYNSFLRAVDLPRLGRLSFYGSFPDAKYIVRFSKRHESTLKHVEGMDLDEMDWGDRLNPVREAMASQMPSIKLSTPVYEHDYEEDFLNDFEGENDATSCTRCAKKGLTCAKPDKTQQRRKRSVRTNNEGITWTQPLLYNGQPDQTAAGESPTALAGRVKKLEELLNDLRSVKSWADPTDSTPDGQSTSSHKASSGALSSSQSVEQGFTERPDLSSTNIAEGLHQPFETTDSTFSLASLPTSLDDSDAFADSILLDNDYPHYTMSIEDLTSGAIALAQKNDVASYRCYLPEVNDGYALLMEFLSDFNSKVPLIAPQHIYAHVRDCYSAATASRTTWMLTYLVLGIAHRLRAMSVFSSPDDMARADWYLNQSLVKLPDLLMQEPSLELVQALLGVSILLETSSRSKRAALFASNAIHMCQDLGYHDYHTVSEDPMCSREQQYVFWIAFRLDTDMSLGALRQNAQKLAEISIPPPDEQNVDWWADTTYTTPTSPTGTGCVNLFALNTSLALIQAEALEGLFSNQCRNYPAAVLDNTFQTINSKLQAWRLKSVVFSVDVQLLYKSMYRSDLVHMIVLEGTYFRTLYQLHAAAAMRGFGTKWDVFQAGSLRAVAGLDIGGCVGDARRLLELAALVEGGNVSTTWICVSAITAALCTVLGTHIRATTSSSTGAQCIKQGTQAANSGVGDQDRTADLRLCSEALSRLEPATQEESESTVASAVHVCRELLTSAEKLTTRKTWAVEDTNPDQNWSLLM
ncbi:hypothetical protein LTR17_005067 [Elasticomyces elasticus]|nr:hypothetical protein LTR17_005067 [Elasticomyces elasticus]